MIATRFVAAVAAEIMNDPPERTSEVYLAKHLCKVLTTAIPKERIFDDDDDDWQVRRPTTTTTTTTTSRLPPDAQLVVAYGGALWIYDDPIWKRLEDDDLTMLCLLYDGKQAIVDDKPVRLSMNHRKAAGIIKCLMSLHHTRRHTFFDNPPTGLAFTDGFWSLRQGKLERQEHHPKHKATFAYDFELDNGGSLPTGWLDFLEELWADDDDCFQKVEALQEWIGAALIGKGVDLARCALFVGGGGNGKSVLMSIIEELFPPETVTTASPAYWDKEYTIATLRDSRLNICSELPEYKALDTSDTFKAITSGDRIMARLPFKEPFSFRPRASHLFAANALPSVGSGDFTHGFFRRFLIFTFNRNFTAEGEKRRDQGEILDEIRAEHGKIILWALAGAARLMARKEYTLPKSHSAALADWHQDSDPVKDFLLSCCRESESPSSLRVVYGEYVEWCELVGRRKMTNRTLAKRLRALGVTMKRMRDGTHVYLTVKQKATWLDAH